MLHYSVNSYTDEKVEIKSPLAIAAIAYKARQASITSVGSSVSEPVSEPT